MTRIIDYVSARDVLVDGCCRTLGEIMENLPAGRLVLDEPVAAELENGPANRYTVSVGEIHRTDDGKIFLVEDNTDYSEESPIFEGGYEYPIGSLACPSDLIDIYAKAVSTVQYSAELKTLFDFSDYEKS